MDSSSTLASSSFLLIKSTSIPSFPILKKQIHFHSYEPLHIKKLMIINASSASSNSSSTPNPFLSTLKTTTTAAVIFAVAVFGSFGKFNKPARAIFPFPPTPTSQQNISDAIGVFKEVLQPLKKSNSEATGAVLESELHQKLNPEAIEALKTLLQKKLKASKKKECLDILHKLTSTQPEITDWTFLAARLLNEMGNTQEAIEVLLPILPEGDLPSVLTMFEISLLVDLSALKEHLKCLDEKIRESSEGVVDQEKQGKEERLLMLFLAQLQFLLNNVDEALRIYEELERQDRSDYRPYFCKGVICTLLDRKKEAREQFAKYRELSPKKIEVEWYLRTPIRRMRLFLTPEDKN
ncbi:protein SLOW GREEN 1, chloroplastic-like [Coffea eugenioides]|uniref:protein SLOW GREEN 1, chloroplastic-like n=1 Tax=Coffea eugenioides TaxID=49369 RepID=UPI000F607157|nr:protein SLOW GREEN 1, chloroplastic-like [Coffea eugenioides]